MCDECHICISSEGAITFINDNWQYHCLNGPATIWPSGTVEYWVNGLLHRDGDEPAVIWGDGCVEYWVNGKRHRDGNRPAIIWANGTVEYWEDGYLKVIRTRKDI